MFMKVFLKFVVYDKRVRTWIMNLLRQIFDPNVVKNIYYYSVVV